MNDINNLLDFNFSKSYSLNDLWHKQVKVHYSEKYRKTIIQKFPQDLWTYEKILWDVKPTLVFEIGVYHGGFSFWLADRLKTIRKKSIFDLFFSKPCVIGIDVNANIAGSNYSNQKDIKHLIRYHNCDICDTNLIKSIARKYIQPNDVILIIEDSAHTYDTTKSALAALSEFVTVKSYFIVEDGCVDYEHLRDSENWPRGVQQAIHEFIKSTSNYEVDIINEKYLITCHPNGFLKKIS